MTIMCISAANYIIERTNEFNENQDFLNQIAMTSKRLQKLLYFSDIQYMKNNNGRSMFSDKYYAWPSGPVIPSVYYKFVKFQDGVMQPLEGNHANITTEMRIAIDTILAKTKDMDTLDLVKYSHVEYGPWESVYNENDPEHQQIVETKSIYEFYKNKDIFAPV